MIIHLGIAIYSMRMRFGLSQTALAVQLGVIGKAVSKWETGASKPKLI